MLQCMTASCMAYGDTLVVHGIFPVALFTRARRLCLEFGIPMQRTRMDHQRMRRSQASMVDIPPLSSGFVENMMGRWRWRM